MLPGTVIFSGSFYLLVLTEQRWLGAVTPVGGLVLLAGWPSLGSTGKANKELLPQISSGGAAPR